MLKRALGVSVLLTGMFFVASPAKAGDVEQIVIASPTVSGIKVVGKMQYDGVQYSLKSGYTNSLGRITFLHTGIPAGKMKAKAEGTKWINGVRFRDTDLVSFVVDVASKTTVENHLVLVSTP